MPFFPSENLIGNVLGYADETGAIVAAYDYDVFGNICSATGPLAGFFRHRFSTKLFDPDIGLCYYGYRWYSPELGRWISRDPIEEAGGENLYGFCKNSQTQKYDGLGLTIEPSLLVFYPDSAIGMDWEYASLADTIGGETHHEEDVECHQICLPRINNYLPLYGIRCNVAIHQRIFLNTTIP